MALNRIEIVSYNRQGSGRTSGQGSAISAHARYLTGQKAPDASIGEHAAHTIRQRPQELVREDLVAWGAQHMPTWAQADPLTYWQAADRYAPRVNTHLGKELVVSLPREFDRAQNLALIHDFLRQMPQGHPTLWAFHEKLARNGQTLQPHVHILCSPRVNTGQHQDAASFFRSPASGGAPQEKPWAMPAAVVQLRRQWEMLLRQTLRQHGLEDTLLRPHRDKEIRLSWQEMQHLKGVIQQEAPNAWGQEHLLRPEAIQQWHDSGHISPNETRFLIQRAARQLYWQRQQAQERLWTATAQRDTARPWQVLTRVRASRAQAVAEQAIRTLGRRQGQLTPLLSRYVAPHVARQQQRQAQRQQARQAWQAARHLVRQRGQEPGGGGGLRVRLEGLEDMLRQLQRQRQAPGRGMEW